jgi:hypothetical protein
MRLRWLASRILAIAVLGAAQTIAACGTSTPAHTVVPPGKIEAIREAQEKAQSQIEAEALLNARKAVREQARTRREAEREHDDQPAPDR